MVGKNFKATIPEPSFEKRATRSITAAAEAATSAASNLPYSEAPSESSLSKGKSPITNVPKSNISESEKVKPKSDVVMSDSTAFQKIADIRPKLNGSSD